MNPSREDRRVIQAGVDGLIDFDLGDLTGKRVSKDETVELAGIPRKEAHGLARAKYVIRSGNTPIAWALGADAWVIPKTNLGTQKARHQALIKIIVDNPGMYR